MAHWARRKFWPKANLQKEMDNVQRPECYECCEGGSTIMKLRHTLVGLCLLALAFAPSVQSAPISIFEGTFCLKRLFYPVGSQ